MMEQSREGVAEGLKFGLVKKESLGAQGHTPQQGHPVKADIAQRMPPSAEARGLFLCGEQRKDEEKADMNMIYNSTSEEQNELITRILSNLIETEKEKNDKAGINSQGGSSMNKNVRGKKAGRRSIGRKKACKRGVNRKKTGRRSIGRNKVGRKKTGRLSIGKNKVGRKKTGRRSVDRKKVSRRSIRRNKVGRKKTGRQSINRKKAGRRGISRKKAGRRSISRKKAGRQYVAFQTGGAQKDITLKYSDDNTEGVYDIDDIEEYYYYNKPSNGGRQPYYHLNKPFYIVNTFNRDGDFISRIIYTNESKARLEGREPVSAAILQINPGQDGHYMIRKEHVYKSHFTCITNHLWYVLVNHFLNNNRWGDDAQITNIFGGQGIYLLVTTIQILRARLSRCHASLNLGEDFSPAVPGNNTTEFARSYVGHMADQISTDIQNYGRRTYINPRPPENVGMWGWEQEIKYVYRGMDRPIGEPAEYDGEMWNIKCFLHTSKNIDVALGFANGGRGEPHIYMIKPTLPNIPYIAFDNSPQVSIYEHEHEIIFRPGCRLKVMEGNAIMQMQEEDRRALQELEALPQVREGNITCKFCELYYNERPSAEDQVDIQQEQLDIPQEQLEELNQIGILDKELNQINPNEIDLMKNNFINEDHS